MGRLSYVLCWAGCVAFVFHVQGVMHKSARGKCNMSVLEVDKLIAAYKKEVHEFCAKRNRDESEFIGAAFHAGYATALNIAKEKSFKLAGTKKEVAYIEDIEAVIVPSK